MRVPQWVRESYLHQPLEVSVETFALCNAACTFCPYPTLERKGTKMSDHLLDRIISELCGFEAPFFFAPFKVNEPFLDPRVIGLCQRLNELQPLARLRLFTNGSTLTPSRIIEIGALSNVEHLWVSLNSHVPADYRALMGLHFDQTAQKLDTLHTLIETGNFHHPVILSKVSATPHNEWTFEDYCKTRWPLFLTHIIKRDGWLGFVPPADPRIPDAPCGRWFELSILATGLVSLCCMDGKGEFPIGDLRSEHATLLSIYNAPHYKERREHMLSRRAVHPCSTCTY